MPNRQNALNNWLQQIPKLGTFSLLPLTGDASFRRYFRLSCHQGSRIVMDAPPEKEPLKSFIEVAKRLSSHGIKTPYIYAADEQQGFALLEDLGDCLLLNSLSTHKADTLYKNAINTLIRLQQCPTTNLPHFDQAFILKELAIFCDWFLHRYLQLELSAKEHQMIDDIFLWLSHEIVQQSTVVIHRDYHSRNIMLAMDNQLAIIDFQDAMQGPFTYDLVSLLKDCYIQWPNDTITHWATWFYDNSLIAQQHSHAAFMRAFDLCGLQRHLKVLGVFSRLYLRDDKPGYLNDLPLTLHHAMTSLARYDELQPLYHFMQKRIQLP